MRYGIIAIQGKEYGFLGLSDYQPANRVKMRTNEPEYACLPPTQSINQNVLAGKLQSRFSQSVNYVTPCCCPWSDEIQLRSGKQLFVQ